MMVDGGVGMMRACCTILWPGNMGRAMSANINNTLLSFSVLLMMMGDWRAAALCRSVDDDVPYAVLGLSANESLSTETSAQKVDTPESLPALNWVRAHARFERAEDILLPGLAHGLILVTLDCRAKVEIDGDQDVLDGDERVARGVSGIWKDREEPGEVSNAKGK